MGITYERQFCEGGLPDAGINYVKRTAEVLARDGSVVFRQDDVETPDFWSPRALRTAGQKYFVRPGVSPVIPEGETSIKQMCTNVAETVAASGMEQGYFEDVASMLAFRDDLLWLLIRQRGAFNSPVWFNCRRWHAYKIPGKGGNWAWDPSTSTTIRTTNAYERPQCSACFLVPVGNSIVDGDDSIAEHWKTEARIFKYGSGSGTNFSAIQEKNSRTDSNGKASGLITFLKPSDAVAGVIKSGGTCLAPHQRVYTASGPVAVKDLAEGDRPFVVLSYDPPAGRYKAKAATAWVAGRKRVVRVVTDKGEFDVTHDHPVKLSTGEYTHAGTLRPGQSLFACAIDMAHGHLRVHLRDGRKGKEFFHRLVASDVMLADIEGMAVHHVDENPLNNDPSNLEVKTHADHARDHNNDRVIEGSHIFQLARFSHDRERNGMHASASFWHDAERVNAYAEKQASILAESGRAPAMQDLAAEQKMLNTAFRVLNAGRSIDTFEEYASGRSAVVGRVASKSKLRRQIVNRFGSYAAFVKAVAANNHRVVRVDAVGEMDVYDVGVECPTPDDKSPRTGHNFVIWSGDERTGSGVVVANTRRAAKMVCVDADHPEVEDFIWLKANEEKKAYALMEKGYSGGMEGEAYTTVTGQNANFSVRLTDEFFRLVEGDGDWCLRSRVDGAVTKTLKARGLFRQIAEAAWASADPGLHYDSTQQFWHTCKNSGRINMTNPCSEYLFLDSTACNLASIKLTAFLRDDGVFDVEMFLRAVTVFVIAQDILVDLSSYPTQAIAQNSHDYRTLGLGYMDLGSVLMLKGLPYDSTEGRSYAAAITSLMGAQAYLTSTRLAESKGAFARYAANEVPMGEVVSNHLIKSRQASRAAVGEAKDIFADANSIWALARERGVAYGYRNGQLTLLAPTGTIGYLVDAETTGIEPNLGLMLFKELAGGGTVELPNRRIGDALLRMGYSQARVDAILAYVEEQLPDPAQPGGTYRRGSVVGAPGLDPKHYAVFDCAFPPAHSKGPFIRAEAHVLMMAAVQPFLSGAISKTVNMPRESTVEDIERIYMLGWKEGLKAIAIYRDGTKGAQPVTTTAKSAYKADPYADLKGLPLGERIKQLVAAGVLPEGFGSRKKLPKKRPGFTQSLKIDGTDVYFRSGEYPDGTLGEVWIDVKNDGGTVSGLAGALARSISLGLQHGTPLKAYADLLLFSRFEPHGLVEGHPEIKNAQSIVDLLMRWAMIEYGGEAEALKSVKSAVEPLPDAAQFTGDGPPCSNCGHITKRNGACYRCPNCSETSGCS